VWGQGWHRGVIGIVASKLVDAFHRPAIVLAIDGGLSYGSGRSIPGFDLLKALESCDDLFTKFGGHRQAAGLTIETTRLKEFRTRIAAYANQRLGPDELAPRLRIDCGLPLTAINAAIINGVRALEPFGPGNPRPVFHTGPVEVANGPKVMKSQHLSMTVRQDKRLFRAVAWRMADRVKFVSQHSKALDVAFNLTENYYRGEHTVELSVADVRQTL